MSEDCSLSGIFILTERWGIHRQLILLTYIINLLNNFIKTPTEFSLQINFLLLNQ